MSVYVPGYGTFDPAIPSWLELWPDGTLHNKNATDPSRPWVPPADWRGYPGMVFTPEDTTPPVPPVVEPPPPPVTPPPAPLPLPLDSMPGLLRELYAALDAESEAEMALREEQSRQAALLLAKEANVISLHKEVVVAFQAVLAQLTLMVK